MNDYTYLEETGIMALWAMLESTKFEDTRIAIRTELNRRGYEA